jgi:hypothetical protein
LGLVIRDRDALLQGLKRLWNLGDISPRQIYMQKELQPLAANIALGTY